jgi:hypothetical protein
MGRELAKRDESRITFHEVAGAHHNDVLRMAGNSPSINPSAMHHGRSQQNNQRLMNFGQKSMNIF